MDCYIINIIICYCCYIMKAICSGFMVPCVYNILAISPIYLIDCI